MPSRSDLKAASACLFNYGKFQEDFFDKSKEILSVSHRLQTDLSRELLHNLKSAKEITNKFKKSGLEMFDIWRTVGFYANENNFSDGIAALLDPYGRHKLSTKPIEKLLHLFSPLKYIESTVSSILHSISKKRETKISVFRERSEGSSRPDIEIISQDFIIFIENKLRGTNETFRGDKWQTERMFQDLETKSEKLGIPGSNCLAIFLTPEGKKASYNKFLRISVAELINAIKDAVRESKACPYVCKNSILSFLEYYSKE
jgi:hypothetical protein